MLVDDQDQVEFVSEWGDGIDVMTRTGALETTISGLGQTAGIAFSPSRDVLYVARPAADAITLIDAKTLAVTGSISLPAGSTPDWIALAGGELWIGAGGSTRSLLFVTDPTSGSLPVSVTPPDGLDAAPYLVAGSETQPDLLLTSYGQNADPPLYVARATGDTLTYRTDLRPGSTLSGAAFSPDGLYVTIAVSDYVYATRYRLSDLSEAGRYGSIVPDHATASVAITPDGRYLVSGQNGEGYSVDRSTPLTSPALVPYSVDDLGVSGDGTDEYAVVNSGGTLAFETAPGPASGKDVVASPGPLDLFNVST